MVGGEVINNGDFLATSVRVSATFYNVTGTVAGSGGDYIWGYQYNYRADVAPGDRAPFKFAVTTAPDWDHYRLQVTHARATPTPTSQCFQVANERGYWLGSSYHVVGEVTNGCAATMTYLSAMVTFYDAPGNFVNVSIQRTNPGTVASGGTASFDVVAPTDGNMENMATWRISFKAIAGSPPLPATTPGSAG